MSSLAIDRIGLLVTNDPELGEGPLGIVRDAALVVADGRVAAVERSGVAADERLDAGGRCLIPGFVDSHTHLIFAGDRGAEFAARMAGRPYEAGGIRLTTEATRAASDAELQALAAARGPRRCAPGSPTSRSSPATASTSRPSAAPASWPPSSPTTSPSSAPTSSPPSTRGAPTPTSSSSAARCSPPARRTVAGSTSSASAAPSTPSSRGRCSRRGARPGSASASTATSSAPGRASRLAVELGAASVDHCTYLDDPDIEALAGLTRSRPTCPATDFSTRQPYPDARRAIDAGARSRSRPTRTPAPATRPRCRSASRSRSATCG